MKLPTEEPLSPRTNDAAVTSPPSSSSASSLERSFELTSPIAKYKAMSPPPAALPAATADDKRRLQSTLVFSLFALAASAGSSVSFLHSCAFYISPISDSLLGCYRLIPCAWLLCAKQAYICKHRQLNQTYFLNCNK